MTIIRHELKLGWKSLSIWTAAIGFFIAICVLMYPEMEGEMEGVNDMFASMGAFTAAFGMDRLNFGTLIGFYAVECGNVLGIGGALFASMLGVSMLAKEEKDGTVEFLLAHPVKRWKVVTEKILAVMLQIVMLNVIVFVIAAGSIQLIGEPIPWKELVLLHMGNLLVQVQLASICFGISAFLKRSGIGVGMGLAMVMYFLNIVANTTEDAEFLKYITPFGYAEGADIINTETLDEGMVLVGMGLAVICILTAYWKYQRKDV